MPNTPVTWRSAWSEALYGAEGFFRRSRPAAHFRTNAHVDVFAEGIAELARRTSARTVVDLGAGGGELLTALSRSLPDTRLVGIELAPRPTGLPATIEWSATLPDRVDGLLVANEWLDNVPCDVVERGDDRVVREVMVDPSTGQEGLGHAHPSPWLDTWWPLGDAGERAEDGSARDAAWADVVSRVDGVAVAIDYGHLRDARPPFGTLRSYLEGREVDVRPDGTRDVTAHVAVDAVAAAVGATLVRQRDALARLGVDGSRPPLELATTDPIAYLGALGRSGEAAELLARGGLGDFWWIITDTTGHGRLNA